MAPRGVKRKLQDDAPVQNQKDIQMVHDSLHGGLKLPGEVFVWGEGDCGQLGTGPDLMGRYRPVQLTSLSSQETIQVEAGGMHSLVLTEKGEVYSWGVNDESALGRETDDDGSTIPGKVDKGMPLKKSGEKVVQISGGDSHSCALTDAGRVLAWGTYRDENGPMGLTLQTHIAPTPIPLPLPTSVERRVVKIASGADHTIALLQHTGDGASAVLTWGSGTQGQLGRVAARISVRHRKQTYLTPQPVSLPRGAGPIVKDVFAGFYGSFVLTAKDEVFACGLNNFGQLGTKPGSPFYTFHKIKELSGIKVKEIALGQHHGLALVDSGKDAATSDSSQIWSFGTTSYGRLGREVTEEWKESPSALPAPIPEENFQAAPIQVSAGIGISGCVCKDGSVYTWGCNVSFQNAKGDDDDDEMKPRKLPDTKGYKQRSGLQMQFGGQHTLLLANDRPT